MKKIIFSLAVILFAFSSYGKSISEVKVPILVKAAFYNTFPMADHVKWEVNDEHIYKADFKIDNIEKIVFYNDQGKFIESDIAVEWKDIPFTGRMEVYHSGNDRILKVFKITNQKQEVYYRVELQHHHKKFEMLLDKEGNHINF